MKKNNKIYIAGHKGMVGSAIIRFLKKKGYNNLITASHTDLDLIDQNSVSKFFENNKIDYVFLAAAKVGGIYANDTYRGEFLYENLMIQNNVIHEAHKQKVKKLLFLGSACIYPRNASQPIKEEYLLSDYPEPTNEPYAIAKIAGIKLCESYYKQYGVNFISVMPNNLYGPNDSFDLKSSHVLPALIRKFHEAKIHNYDHVEVWGSGSPLRELLHVDDMAFACLFIMENISADQIYSNNISCLNVGTGDEISILNLANMIKDIVRYDGKIIFNTDYPDGAPRKILDTSRMNNYGWESTIKLYDGIKSVYRWYVDNAVQIN